MSERGSIRTNLLSDGRMLSVTGRHETYKLEDDMKGFIRFNKGVLGMSLPVKLWMLVLVAANE